MSTNSSAAGRKRMRAGIGNGGIVRAMPSRHQASEVGEEVAELQPRGHRHDDGRGRGKKSGSLSTITRAQAASHETSTGRAEGSARRRARGAESSPATRGKAK